MNKTTILCLAVLTAVGCGRRSDDGSSAEDSLNATESVVESGVTVVSGMADEQSNSSLALKSEPEKPTIWWVLLRPETASATACSRAVAATCSSGQRSALYADCSVSGTLRTMNGQVDLSYSQTDCSMALTGDSVTRSFNVTVTGARSGQFTLSSQSQTDYVGNTYGGGGRLTKTSGGWDLEILGRHSSFERNGRRLMSVSVRTLSPLHVSGSLGRSSRSVSGGQLEVNHNLAGFTAVFAPSASHPLQWTAGCCHPTSGQLGVTYSGAKTGSATVDFAGCGTANLTEGGQTSQITLSYCE